MVGLPPPGNRLSMVGMCQVYSGQRPERSIIAQLTPVLLLAAALAVAGTFVFSKQRANRVSLGERIRPPGWILSLQVPAGWESLKLEKHDDATVVLQESGSLAARRLRLSKETGAAFTLPGTACLSHLTAYLGAPPSGILPLPYTFGPFPGAKVALMASNPGSAPIAISVRSGVTPTGDSYAIVLDAPESRGHADERLLDRIVDSITVEGLQLGDDFSWVADAVGFSFKPSAGARIVRPAQQYTPSLMLVSQADAKHLWRLEMRRLWRAPGTTTESILRGYLCQALRTTKPEYEFSQLRVADQAGHRARRKGRTSARAPAEVWCVEFADQQQEVLLIVGYAARDGVRLLAQNIQSIADSVKPVADRNVIDVAAAQRRAVEINRQIAEQGVDTWIPEEEAAHYYVIRRAGVPFGYEVFVTSRVQRRHADGISMQYKLIRDNALGRNILSTEDGWTDLRGEAFAWSVTLPRAGLGARFADTVHCTRDSGTSPVRIHGEVDGTVYNVDQHVDQAYASYATNDLARYLVACDIQRRPALFSETNVFYPEQLTTVLVTPISLDQQAQTGERYAVLLQGDSFPAWQIVEFDDNGIMGRREFEDCMVWQKSTLDEISHLFAAPSVSVR